MSRHWVIVESAAELRFWSDEGWVSDVQEAKLYSEQEKLETFNPVGGLWKLAGLYLPTILETCNANGLPKPVSESDLDRFVEWCETHGVITNVSHEGFWEQSKQRIHWRNLSLAEQEKFAKLSIGSELSAVQLAYLSDVKRKERRSVKHED
jgi:hypothetical protein